MSAESRKISKKTSWYTVLSLIGLGALVGNADRVAPQVRTFTANLSSEGTAAPQLEIQITEAQIEEALQGDATPHGLQTLATFYAQEVDRKNNQLEIWLGDYDRWVQELNSAIEVLGNNEPVMDTEEHYAWSGQMQNLRMQLNQISSERNTFTGTITRSYRIRSHTLRGEINMLESRLSRLSEEDMAEARKQNIHNNYRDQLITAEAGVTNIFTNLENMHRDRARQHSQDLAR